MPRTIIVAAYWRQANVATVVDVRADGAHHRQSFFDIKERLLVMGAGDGDVKAVAERSGAADDVFMTARDGVKRTGINGDARHAAASSA